MRIAVMTSGGDAPGMNAALRSFVLVSVARGHEVLGVMRGYEGLLDDEFVPLSTPDVDNISRLGGTILGSGRSKRMPTPEGQELAHRRLLERGIDVLMVVGGNGSLTGAHVLASREPAPCQILGLPASIDNDVGHCDMSIGADTATNTIVEACDRILDTARAHRRAFLVEVMGRNSGFLAMRAGIAAEADAILYSESRLSEADTLQRLQHVLLRCFSRERGHRRALIVKAEGASVDTNHLVAQLQSFLDREAPGVGIRATILGHVVRGGSPSALDRMIAQRLAYAAVLAAEMGLTGQMLSWKPPLPVGQMTADPSVCLVPFQDMLDETKKLLDGSSIVVQKRVELLNNVEHMLSL